MYQCFRVENVNHWTLGQMGIAYFTQVSAFRKETMRKPEYLSPSAVALYRQDPRAYFLQYLADVRPPRQQQTQPMSVGSAFDAYTKSDLHYKIFGNNGANEQFGFQKLFETQVEAHNREWALVAGKVCYDQYVKTGALTDLLGEISKGIGEPRFEIDIRTTIAAKRDHAGVPILGKPDCIFRNHEGAVVILDWKVNGYCGKGTTSPMKGYLKLRPGGSTHKECFAVMHRGMTINKMYRLEELKEDWAAQLGQYGWSTGEPVGSEFIAWIDQLACGGSGTEIRVATHRSLIGAEFQFKTLNEYITLWDAIQTGYIFKDMSREDNDSLCNILSKGIVYTDVENGSKEDFFNKMVHPPRAW